MVLIAVDVLIAIGREFQRVAPAIENAFLCYYSGNIKFDGSRIYPSLRIYLSFQQLYLHLFQQLNYASLPESIGTPPSQNIPPFYTYICDPLIIHPSIPAYTPFLRFHSYLERSQNPPLPPRYIVGASNIVAEGWGIFWEGWVDSEIVVYRPTSGFLEGRKHMFKRRFVFLERGADSRTEGWILKAEDTLHDHKKEI